MYPRLKLKELINTNSENFKLKTNDMTKLKIDITNKEV